MKSDGITFRKIAMTAGFVLAVAVFAGCAFKSIYPGVTETETETGITEASEMPTAISVESLAATTAETTPEPETTEGTEDGSPDETTDAASGETTEEAASETTSDANAAPTPKSVKVTFVGDCTLCSDARGYNHFDSVVKKRWNYPFKNCKSIFAHDDLTLANCEMAITSSKKHRKKAFVFAMNPSGTKYFTHASIEAVNLANNHTLDFGTSGLKDTRRNLKKAGILWSDTSNYAIYTAKNGVKIGMCGYTSTYGLSKTYKLIKQLRAKGCQIVIVSCHWGIEARYTATKSQKSRGHALINHGADIIVGTHPHRLQPIEVYKGKYILYSIGNFCFGGHTNPSDPDTAVVQCTFVLNDEGTKVTDYRLHVMPFSLRSSKRGNDYCPKPYNYESKAYDRVMARLNWAEADE